MNICTVQPIDDSHEKGCVMRYGASFDGAYKCGCNPTKAATKNVKYDQDRAPLVRGCFRYFPDALEAVAFISNYGAVKYEVELEALSWSKVSNGEKRYLDADGRHLIRDGYDQESGYLHAAHRTWNSLAELQFLLESGTPLIDPVRGKGPHGIINKTEGKQT